MNSLRRIAQNFIPNLNWNGMENIFNKLPSKKEQKQQNNVYF